MYYHQSYVFPQDLSNSFYRWLNLFVLILPECLNNSWWCSSSSFSAFEDRRRFFSQSCSILFKIRDSSLLPSSYNYFRLWEFFSPIRRIWWVFSIPFPRRPSFQILFILAFSSHPPNFTGASIKYPLISAWSLRSLIYNFSQASSFIC